MAGKLLALLREHGRISNGNYDDDEIHVTALVTPKLAGQMRKLMGATAQRNELVVGPMLNLPNFLTLIRILTIPFFLVYLSYHRYGEALIIFVIGGVTDFLDGFAARLMKQQTL